jgi:osmoprotectant transport system substrate-binding protein
LLANVVARRAGARGMTRSAEPGNRGGAVRKERKWFRGRMFTAFVVVLALVAAGCGGDDDDDDSASGTSTPGDAAECGSVTVGSTNFSEQLIVASMYAQVLEAAGCDVTVRDNLGAREVVFPALESGEIDLVAEYIGTLLEFLNEGAGEATSDADASLELLRGYLGERGLTALEPSEAQDRNALAVTSETAEQYDLETVSDLQPVAGELVIGGPPECPERPLCLPGYQSVYGLSFREFRPLDAGGPLTFQALENGDIQVAVVFSTQGQLDDDDLVVLEEDMDLQPAENVLPVIRDDVLNDTVRNALDSVTAVLTTEELVELNKRVDIDLEDAEEVARSFLEDEGLV